MVEKFEYEGYWWVPDNPEENISGILRFDPEQGARLELWGVFKKVDPFQKLMKSGKVRFPSDTVRYDIILGITPGKKITLHDCQGWYGGFSSPGYDKSTLIANTVFIGEHFPKTENLKFKKINIRYSYLDEWAGTFGGSVKLPTKKTKTISMVYAPPKSIQLMKTRNYQLLLDFTAKYSGLSFFTKEFHVAQEARLKIEMNKEVPLEDYLNLIYYFQNFISLAVMKPSYPLSISGITDYNKEERSGKTYNPPVDIIYLTGGVRSEPEDLSPHDILFRYPAVKDRISTYLKNWFRKSELLSPVYGLYFAVRYKPEMYSELQFFSLTQALEVYHARTTKTNLDLIKRIKELVNKPAIKTLVDKFIGDGNQFAATVKNTRHYFTHYNEKYNRLAALGPNRLLLIRQMKLLLEIYLLREIGFKWSEIKNLIKNSRNYGDCIQMKLRFEKESKSKKK